MEGRQREGVGLWVMVELGGLSESEGKELRAGEGWRGAVFKIFGFGGTPT